MTLTPIHTLAEVAVSLGVTSRFLREYVNANHVEHLRVGNGPNARIKFNDDQVERLQAMFVTEPAPESITTGRKRKAS